MELKVWVEGIQRIVCGVTVNTTCQDVVFALAHASGKIGRFTLIERWRNNERLLAPNENPLKILSNWGEYSNDVQFILQSSDQVKNKGKLIHDPSTKSQTSVGWSKNLTSSTSTKLESIETKELNNVSSGFEGSRKENIGFVKGIPNDLNQKNSFEGIFGDNGSPKINKYSNIEFNMADVRQSLDCKINVSEDKQQIDNDILLDVINCNKVSNSGPSISSNGALVPPPYREPPAPQTSPVQNIDNLSYLKCDLKDCSIASYLNFKVGDLDEYKDLFHLIKCQREKLNSQQADLTKYDAEIIYLENKERDQIHQFNLLNREINKTDQLFRQGNEQLQTLQYVEEENELVRQQEKTLKSEITLLRSKLANCETELLQCKNKIRMLLDDIQIEQRTVDTKDTRQMMERSMLSEVEKIQKEIDQAIEKTELSNKATENLKTEVTVIENATLEKKRQVEQLVNDMKEVNLQSLTVTASDEIRSLLEGSNKLGSSRRIIGSPRQLENAAPTNKNPHGVWV